jgi:hypothetical protein
VVNWDPTFGIAITLLTAYLTYTSLRLDRVIRGQGEERALQKERDKKAYEDREAIKEKAVSDAEAAANAAAALKDRADRRARRITWALTVIGIIVAALAVPQIAKHIGG